VPSAQVYQSLADLGVNAPASSFYALEASRWMGLGDTGAVRAGIAPYSTAEEVDRLVAGVAKVAR
jgi:selenocysteine lyase/cysteine desulfurase